MKGAYTAGADATLCEELGKDYFDNIYAYSVGVYSSTFAVANQPDIIKETWRNRVHGKQLVNAMNFFNGRQILDLEYLEEIFQEGRSALDVDAVINSRTKIEYVLTDWKTGKPCYVRPTRESIFRQMSASCAIPFVHNPVILGEDLFFDGGFSCTVPLQRAIDDGNEEILIILNSSLVYFGVFKKKFDTCWSVSRYGFNNTRRLWKSLDSVADEVSSCSLVKVIHPTNGTPLKSKFDTDKERINQTLDMGVKDTYAFLKKNNL